MVMKMLSAMVMGFCVLAAAALPSARAQVAGGWSNASVKEEGVVQAAQFAVKVQQQTMKAAGKSDKVSLIKIARRGSRLWQA